jgi:nucleoside-diphosphate-sugar epimerase
MKHKRKLVITGGAGYIGSVLTKAALDSGYEVHVADRFFFGTQGLDNFGAHLHRMDSREINPEILRGAYAVLDLAAISNDPAGDLNPEITIEINFKARERLQDLCNQTGVERYVLASSCSVYGFQEQIVDEKSTLNPLTTYARANVLAEQSAWSNDKGKTCFTALRQATVYGLSDRMRFDLAVNAMTLNLWKHGSLKILRDGSQWRPMVHVRDTARAFLTVIDSPDEKVRNQVFNVGSGGQNYQIIEIARQIASALNLNLELDWYGDPDLRSYRVDFSKISQELGFNCELSVVDAALEIVAALNSGECDETEMTKTVSWYQALKHWDSVLESVRLEGRILE